MGALTAEALSAALEALPGWANEDNKLKKMYVFGSFREAVSFIVALAFEAEALDHHPELFNVYNRVRIELTTHDEGNTITEKDVQLARAIEKIAWV